MARTWIYTLMMLAALIALEGIKPASAMDHFYGALYAMPQGHTVPRMPQYTPPPEFTMNADGTFVGEAPFAIRAAQNYRQDCIIFRCNPKSGPSGCACKSMTSPLGGVVPFAQNDVISEIK